MSKNKNFSSISEVISGWFDNKNYTQKREDYNAFHSWNKIVGCDIAKNTAPVKIQKGILIIKVRNSVWTQELQYLKPQLLDKIKSALPETDITDLIFKVGEIKKSES